MGFLSKFSPAATKSKVFPSSVDRSNSTNPSSASDNLETNTTEAKSGGGGEAVALTVWKKSLLTNCNGFTVFNGDGNLVYRVDNYTGNKREIVLMDATGKALLTIYRKRLRVGDYWLIYNGEKTGNRPQLCVRKNINLLNSKTILAHVCTGTTIASSSSLTKNNEYKIEGSYAKRNVSIYDSRRRCVAEIRRKEAAGGISLGVDVFNLISSEASTDTTMTMGLVIVLEEMFGSASS